MFGSTTNKDSGGMAETIASMTNILVVPQESEPLVNITDFGVTDRTPTHTN